MRKNNIDLSISIPFYNEEDNVENVIDDLNRVLDKSRINYEIIAVNNGSYDNTGSILEKIKSKDKRVKVITVKKNIGYGYGIIQGLKNSNGRIIGFFDGDAQVKADIIPLLYRKLKDDSIFLVKVKRIERNDGFNRRIQSRVYNNLIRLLFNLNSDDVNGKPKLMRRELFNELKLSSKDWFIDSEIMLKLKKLNYDFSELPVVFDKRSKGKSHVGLSAIVQFLRNLMKQMLL